MNFEGMPKQEQLRLQHHAKTRYQQKEFAESIDTFHQGYVEFFAQSVLENNPGSISKEESIHSEKQHRKQWQSLLQRYQTITQLQEFNMAEPKKAAKEPHSQKSPSALHTDDEYQIFIQEQSKEQAPEKDQDNKPEKSDGWIKNSLFYSGLAVAGTVTVCMLLAYFGKSEKTIMNSFKP